MRSKWKINTTNNNKKTGVAFFRQHAIAGVRWVLVSSSVLVIGVVGVQLGAGEANV